MNYDSYGQSMPHPSRRNIRLKGYDYAQPGAHFVPSCAQNGACLFGDVAGGKMQLNDIGAIVRQCWLDIPAHFLRVRLDAFVVMPNLVHGILWIVGDYDDGVGTWHAVPSAKDEPWHILPNPS